jgi:RNA polymerase sigma-70 factor (ECF subfamily)
MDNAVLELVFAPPADADDSTRGGRPTIRETTHERGAIDQPAHEETERILARLAASDVVAFDEIVLTYDVPLRAFARRMMRDPHIADDVVQDVFAWIWEHRATLRPKHTIRSYLYGAVRHRALHLLRRTRIEDACVMRIDPTAGVPGMGAPQAGASTAAERRELGAALTQAFMALSPRVRHVALLRWRDRLSRAEIAAIMGVTVPTVNNHLTHAARVVRALLAEHGPATE